MFGAPNLRQSKKITQPLVAMVGTFRMSVEMQCLSSEAAPDCSQQETDF